MRAPKLTLAERNELVRSVFSLLLTTAFLLTGHGLHMTFLPLWRARSVCYKQSSALGFCLLRRFHFRRTRDTSHHREGGTYGSQRRWRSSCRSRYSQCSTLVGMDFCALFAGRCDVRRHTVVESWLSDQADSRPRSRSWDLHIGRVGCMAAGQGILGLTYGDALKCLP